LPLPPGGRRGKLVATRGEVGDSIPRGGVVVSAGGGAAGAALLNAALAARRDGCLADAPWRLLTGANLPEAEYAALCRSAPAGARQPARVMVNTDGAANSARIIAALIDGCPVGQLAAKTGKAMIGQ